MSFERIKVQINNNYFPEAGVSLCYRRSERDGSRDAGNCVSAEIVYVI